ncbi:MAG: DUF1178 family protein [Rhizobiaceae bacterium]
MIRFTLACSSGHEFEGWFRDNADFERLAAAGLNECPVCGSRETSKALMAPAVRQGGERETVSLGMGEEQRRIMKELKSLSDKMREGAEYVGPRFAEEARRIHLGEAEARGIYGEATREDAAALNEEGVPVMPLPTFPDDKN